MRSWLRTSSISAAGREVAALAKQAVLLPYDVGAPVIPAAARDGDDIVVLLHGLFASAGVLRPLRAAIGGYAARPSAPRAGRPAAAIHTAAMTYAPGPGVEALAERLAEVMAKLPSGARVHLVGHSMGGVVCRFFAQEVGDPRIAQTISMASPFAGIRGVGLLRFGGARDLEPSSPLLRRVRLGTGRSSLPHLSIIAGDDTLVTPPIAHALPGGEVRLMAGRGHNAVLFDEEVAAIVARRVLERRSALAADIEPHAMDDAAPATEGPKPPAE